MQRSGATRQSPGNMGLRSGSTGGRRSWEGGRTCLRAARRESRAWCGSTPVRGPSTMHLSPAFYRMRMCLRSLFLVYRVTPMADSASFRPSAHSRGPRPPRRLHSPPLQGLAAGGHDAAHPPQNQTPGDAVPAHGADAPGLVTPGLAPPPLPLGVAAGLFGALLRARCGPFPHIREVRRRHSAGVAAPRPVQASLPRAPAVEP